MVLLTLVASAASAQIPQPPPFPQQRLTMGAPGDDPGPSPRMDLPCPQGKEKKDEARFGDYVISTYRGPDLEGCLQILKSGVLVYTLSSHDFRIGNNFWHGTPIPIGTDITGAGKPDAIVSEWSGGAHCCFTLHIFELGERFREIARIEAEHGDGSNFEDLNHDGSYELVGSDWAFAYWKASFADSPAPRVVLKYRAGRFRLALDLMRTPNPSSEKFKTMVESVRSARGWSSQVILDCQQECGIAPALWANMLDLIYGGHPDLAWELFDESWPKNLAGKATFAKEFCSVLKKSRYWHDLKEMAGRCPPQGAP